MYCSAGVVVLLRAQCKMACENNLSVPLRDDRKQQLSKNVLFCIQFIVLQHLPREGTQFFEQLGVEIRGDYI